MAGTNSLLDRGEVDDDDEFEGFGLPNDLFQLDDEANQWLSTLDDVFNVDSVEIPNLKRKSTTNFNFDNDPDLKRSCLESEFDKTNIESTSAETNFETISLPKDNNGKNDEKPTCSSASGTFQFDDQDSMPLNDILTFPEYETEASHKDYDIDFLHDDKEGPSTSTAIGSTGENKEIDCLLQKMENFFKIANDTERAVYICGAIEHQGVNYLLMEKENYVEVQLSVYRNGNWQFQIFLNLYGNYCNHKGNKNSCFIHFQFNQEIPWLMADLNEVMLTVLDFLIDQDYRRCFFQMENDAIGRNIVDAAYSSRKLQPHNCDIPQITVDEKKWNRILAGKPILYWANQMLSNQHWTEGKLDSFPLYLSVFERMESEFKRIVPSEMVSYEQFRIADEFKNTGWKKFRRAAKERILPQKDSNFILCLIPKSKLKQITI